MTKTARVIEDFLESNYLASNPAPSESSLSNTMRAALWLIPFLAVCLCGCRSTRSGASSADSEPKWKYWQPHLLLAAPSPHARLEIEIDAVAGAEPTAADLRALQTFFETHCRKPSGVTVRLDPPIPTAAASGLTAQNLAGRHCDGPREPESAFAYFLFYDTRLAGLKPHKPFTTRTPYPASVFVDRQYVQKWTRWPGSGVGSRLMILHEAGHLLGLASNPAHADGRHCSNAPCLMNATINLRLHRILLPGPVIYQRELCADCLDELAISQNATPPANVHFRGLYAVRSEPLYHVISSPGFTYIHPGPLDNLSFDRVDERRRTLFREKCPKKEESYFHIEFPEGMDPAPVLPALAADPVSYIRDLPRLIQDQLTPKPE